MKANLLTAGLKKLAKLEKKRVKRKMKKVGYKW